MPKQNWAWSSCFLYVFACSCWCFCLLSSCLLSSERINGQRRKTSKERCASAFHPSKTQKKDTKSGRLRRPLCVRVFRVLEGWNALAHSFSRGFGKRLLILSDDNTRNYRSRTLGCVVASLVVVTCRSRVICKKVASQNGTIGAQSEN